MLLSLARSREGFSVARRMLAARTEREVVDSLNDLENLLQDLREFFLALSDTVEAEDMSQRHRTEWTSEMIACAKEAKARLGALWTPVAGLAFGRCLKLMREQTVSSNRVERSVTTSSSGRSMLLRSIRGGDDGRLNLLEQ